MALNLIVAALERGPASPTDALVLIAICDSADKVSGEAWPSLRSLAQAARVSPRSVRRIVARLVADGWVTVEKRSRANGSQASNLYTVNLAQLGELRTPPDSVSSPPRTLCPPPPDSVSPHAPDSVSSLEPSHHKEPRRGGRRAGKFSGEKGKGGKVGASSLRRGSFDPLDLLADRINSDRYVSQAEVSTAKAAALVSSGRVSAERMRQRGFAV